jgi:superfamily II DNA/RNA helicase
VLRNGVEVLVATPGRLLDLVTSNALRLGEVEFLVLDEADRMLDMGFIHDIRKIAAKLPARRQTLFFSATMPRAIAALADQMLREPTKVAVAQSPRRSIASSNASSASIARRSQRTTLSAPCLVRVNMRVQMVDSHCNISASIATRPPQGRHRGARDPR